MKTRNGFVSNSSSSSFIIAVKNGELEDKLDEISDEMESKLGKNFPFVSIIGKIFSYIKDNSREHDVSEEIYDDYDEDEFWSEHPEMKKLVDGGYKLYECTASSDDYESVGLYLYNMAYDIEYENKDKSLIITQIG